MRGDGEAPAGGSVRSRDEARARRAPSATRFGINRRTEVSAGSKGERHAGGKPLGGERPHCAGEPRKKASPARGTKHNYINIWAKQEADACLQTPETEGKSRGKSSAQYNQHVKLNPGKSVSGTQTNTAARALALPLLIKADSVKPREKFRHSWL